MFELACLTSSTSDRVKRLSSLQKRAGRRKTGLTLVEGPQALYEALQECPQALGDVYVQVDEAGQPLAPLRSLASAAMAVTRWVHPVSAAFASAVAPSAQGVFASLKLDALPAFQSDSTPARQLENNLTLLLPQTQDPGNLGTLIRIADACGFAQVICVKGGADPYSPKVIRASVGSVFHLPVYAEYEWEQAVREVRVADGKIVAADAHQALVLEEFIKEKLPNIKTLVWILGNEAQGLGERELLVADYSVKIPMWGKAESLNVSTAAAICMHATAEKWYA